MHQAHTRMRTLFTGLYSTLGIVLLSVAIALSGCSEDPSGGSGFTDVARGEPTIIDSVLANNILEDRPSGITNTFFAEFDDQVFLWILWTNITEQHTVEVSWYSPEDDPEDPPFWTDKQSFTSNNR